MMKIQIIIIAMMLSISLSACGGDKSNQNGSNETLEKKQACELLTIDDVQEVVGQKVTMGRHYTDYDCTYDSVQQDANGGPKSKIFLRMTMPAFNISPEEALSNHIKTMKEGLGKDANSYKSTNVAGIGDVAVFDEHLGTEGSVVLVTFRSVKSKGKSGTITITLQLVGFEKENARQYAKSLASKALQRV
jgi:hypothetical protein